MRMYVYDLVNRVEHAFQKPDPTKLTRAEKWALRLVGASGHRIASEEFDAPLLKDTREISQLYGIPDMGKVIIYEHRMPNAAYMRTSNTMLISTALLKNLEREEVRGVIGHEFGHRSRRYLMQGIAFGLTAIAVVTATFFTSKFKNNISEYIRSKAETREEGSFLRQSGEKLATAIHSAPWAVGALYAWIGYGVHSLMRFPEAAIQRQYELDADRQAAEKLGNPAAMANALEKVHKIVEDEKQRPHIVAPTDPAAKDKPVPPPQEEPEPTGWKKTMQELKRTHPPIEKRVAILRDMAARQEVSEGVARV